MAWSFINSATATGPAGAITTTGADTTAATFIVIAVSTFGQPIPTPTDSQSNTWTALTQRFEGANSYGIKMFYVGNPATNASHTFTATTSGVSIFFVVNVLWFSGWSAFDAESGATATSSPIQPGSITPADNNELFVTGVTHNVGSNATIDSSFSTPIGAGQTGGNNVGGNLAYKIKVASASAENPSWTAGGAATMAAAMAAFRTGGGVTFVARRNRDILQAVNRAGTY